MILSNIHRKTRRSETQNPYGNFLRPIVDDQHQRKREIFEPILSTTNAQILPQSLKKVQSLLSSIRKTEHQLNASQTLQPRRQSFVPMLYLFNRLNRTFNIQHHNYEHLVYQPQKDNIFHQQLLQHSHKSALMIKILEYYVKTQFYFIVCNNQNCISMKYIYRSFTYFNYLYCCFSYYLCFMLIIFLIDYNNMNQQRSIQLQKYQIIQANLERPNYLNIFSTLFTENPQLNTIQLRDLYCVVQNKEASIKTCFQSKYNHFILINQNNLRTLKELFLKFPQNRKQYEQKIKKAQKYIDQLINDYYLTTNEFDPSLNSSKNPQEINKLLQVIFAKMKSVISQFFNESHKFIVKWKSQLYVEQLIELEGSKSKSENQEVKILQEKLRRLSVQNQFLKNKLSGIKDLIDS